MEEKFGFLKFQINRRDQSRDILRYVPYPPLCVALDCEMYVLLEYSSQMLRDLPYRILLLESLIRRASGMVTRSILLQIDDSQLGAKS